MSDKLQARIEELARRATSGEWSEGQIEHDILELVAEVERGSRRWLPIETFDLDQSVLMWTPKERLYEPETIRTKPDLCVDDVPMIDPWPNDLYPPPGKPSRPPSWEDIERLAQSYPVLHAAVTLYRRTELTREQALILAVFALADAFQRLFVAEVERRRNEPAPRDVRLSDE